LEKKEKKSIRMREIYIFDVLIHEHGTDQCKHIPKSACVCVCVYIIEERIERERGEKR
jgi:hypothetical protein